MNRLPNSSKASSCGLRRPVAKISRSMPSGSQRSTAPVSGRDERPAVGACVTFRPRSPMLK